MRKKDRFIAGVVSTVLAASVCAGVAFGAQPTPELKPQKHGQCWTADQLFTKDAEGLGGGKGTLYGEFPFRREQALETDAVKEIGLAKLEKGAFVGTHLHKENEDAYIIVSGKGVFTDGNDNAWIVGPGDITIARPGQKHGLANLYDEDLHFIYIIAQNHGADIDAITSKPTGQMFPTLTQFQRYTEKAGGGEGTLAGKYAFCLDQATIDQAEKEIGILTLKPGDSIGKHEHKDDEAVFIILGGTGSFTDTAGKKTAVGPRSVMIAGPGESHALANDGKEDLIFVELIAKNHALGLKK